MASGSRMAVTKCAPTSTVVTWVAMSGRVTIRGWGSAVCACAQAAKVINATVQNAGVMTYLLVWFGYAAGGTGGLHSTHIHRLRGKSTKVLGTTCGFDPRRTLPSPGADLL